MSDFLSRALHVTLDPSHQCEHSRRYASSSVASIHVRLRHREVSLTESGSIPQSLMWTIAMSNG